MRKNKPVDRRTALAAIGGGLGLTALPTAAARRRAGSNFDGTNRRRTEEPGDFQDFLDRLEAARKSHGETVDTSTEVLGSDPKVLERTLEFADGTRATIAFRVESSHVIRALWDGREYVLNKRESPLNGDGIRAQSVASTVRSNVGSLSSDDEWTHVQIGDDRYFTSATHDRDRTVNDWLGDARADTDGNECQVATRATALGIPGAFAQTWVSLEIESANGEPNDKHADFEVSTERAVAWTAQTTPWYPGGASGAWAVAAYIWDYEAGEFIDIEKIADGRVAPVDFRTSTGESTTNIGVNLETGKHYGVGIYAGCHSASVLVGNSNVDMHPSGNFDGGVSWDAIDLDWS